MNPLSGLAKYNIYEVSPLKSFTRHRKPRHGSEDQLAEVRANRQPLATAWSLILSLNKIQLLTHFTHSRVVRKGGNYTHQGVNMLFNAARLEDLQFLELPVLASILSSRGWCLVLTLKQQLSKHSHLKVCSAACLQFSKHAT